MGMNDVEIWQNGHKGLKGESCYRVGYGEVNDLGGYYTYQQRWCLLFECILGKSLVLNKL